MDALTEYTARRAAWQTKHDFAQRRFILIGNWRLAVGLTFAAVLALSAGFRLVSAWWLIPPFVVFVALIIWHSKVITRRTFAERALRHYDAGLMRLRDEWSGKGVSGDRFRNPNHVYCEDLDVFGKGSLFELLCTARTAAGEDALAAWLLQPAGNAEVSARQQAIQELRNNLDLREDIAMLGEDVRSGVRAEVITRWGCRPPIVVPRIIRPLAFGLSIGVLLTGLLAFADGPRWPVAILLIVNASILYVTRHQVGQILANIDAPSSHLAVLSMMIARFEKESFEAPRLKELLLKLQTSGVPAAQRIRSLGRLIDLNSMSSHYLMRLIRWWFLWRVQVALAIEAWRNASGPLIQHWIEAVGEFEALLSLAALHFERPAWVFPTLLNEPQAAFEAGDLRHPLMPSARCVPNNVTLHQTPRLFIVSGSNMSGKSTLLRSVGLNTVLARAGAPVNATRMLVSALHPGASLRAIDSLEDNRSRFFAEITRLRLIVDLARTQPTLFLLDELLSGTNSHDRRIGAAAFIRSLLKANTIGMVTTHDLALADVAHELPDIAANVHFEDKIVDGQVQFDYHLHPGIVTHSNALELMRAVGLEV